MNRKSNIITVFVMLGFILQGNWSLDNMGLFANGSADIQNRDLKRLNSLLKDAEGNLIKARQKFKQIQMKVRLAKNKLSRCNNFVSMGMPSSQLQSMNILGLTVAAIAVPISLDGENCQRFIQNAEYERDRSNALLRYVNNIYEAVKLIKRRIDSNCPDPGIEAEDKRYFKRNLRESLRKVSATFRQFRRYISKIREHTREYRRCARNNE